MRFEALWVPWPIPFLTRATRGLGGTESQITQHRLYNVPLSRFGFLPGLGTNENLQWQWPPRGIPPARRVFLGKILGIREQLAASHVNSQSLLNARPDYPRKQRKVNPTNAAGFLRGAFSLEKARNVGAITASRVNSQSPRTHDALSLKKHMESGRVSVMHALVEKRYGIRERLVACHMNLQSHWTQDAFNPRKHKESEPKECGRITARHIFFGKGKECGSDNRITCKFTITSNARRTFIEETHGIWKGFRDARFSWKKIRNPGAVGRVSYEFTITLNARRI